MHMCSSKETCCKYNVGGLVSGPHMKRPWARHFITNLLLIFGPAPMCVCVNENYINASIYKTYCCISAENIRKPFKIVLVIVLYSWI